MTFDTRPSPPDLDGSDESTEPHALGLPLVLPEVPVHLRAQRDAGGAVAWSEPIVIDTYAPAEPSTYPMYLDQRVYQGSSGRVYPLPFYERIASEPTPHTWQAIHLENEFIRLVILPELGGRIHIGYDKTTGYDFFYRNNVLKPALVGLTGPWISGGVEFNWPQHHRPATFLPVETSIEYSDDGSVVVWCSDHDPFARMQGTHGVRIHPNRSVVQVDVRLHNRTSDRQTFLWWANVAVRVHNDYQSFFPEDVRYVADHARRSITTFPAADRPYCGVDYAARAAEVPGADRIDWYRNIPVPTSYMIVDTEDDFFGGYDHAAAAGFVHWADRRIAPGKKQWTWGDAAFGHAWDSHLTDNDGPYVELMAGVYTDNQPDFSWIAPGETKRFSQFWYPIPGIGVAHQATPEAAVHVDRDSDLVSASFAVTSPRAAATAVFRDGQGVVIAEENADLVPGQQWTVSSGVSWSDGMTVELLDSDGAPLVVWNYTVGSDEEPWTATEPADPADIASNDELFLTGLHLQQFRHPTRSAHSYWDEALRRDPLDLRVRLALADTAYRSGDYVTAREHIDRALERATRRNANPRDAEVYYLRGLIESRLGNVAEAEAAWAKAFWDAGYVASAGLELARQSARAGRGDQALRELAELNAVAANDRRRYALEVVLLRQAGRGVEAQTVLDRALGEDPLNATLRYLSDGTLPVDSRSRKDVGVELAQAGEIDSALAVLEQAAEAEPTGAGNAAPVAHYIRAQLLDAASRHHEADAARALARSSDLRWAFPAGLDDHDALVAAIEASQDDTVAAGLLGMLLYDAGRRTEALALWVHAIECGSTDPIIYRNAGLASYNVAHNDEAAVRFYEGALALDRTNARLVFERDQLAQRLGETAEARLGRLESQLAAVLVRDDLVVEYANLLVASGRAQEALELLNNRTFQPWEGGEGRVLGAWDRARAALGLPLGDPPRSFGEARTSFVPPVARHDTGKTDYFATSLPELLLFSRE